MHEYHQLGKCSRRCRPGRLIHQTGTRNKVELKLASSGNRAEGRAVFWISELKRTQSPKCTGTFFSLTPQLSKVKELIEEEGNGTEVSVVVTGGGCSGVPVVQGLRLTRVANEDDTTLDKNGGPLLVIR